MPFAFDLSALRRYRTPFVVGALMFLSSASAILAQSEITMPGQRATRSEIAMVVQSMQSALAGTALRKEARSRTEADLAALKSRLEDGDFRIGDRFVYTLAQDTVRSDTASVRDGLVVAVSNLPDFSVRGVLRAELTDQLQAHVARFIRNVTVRTNVLTRVAILGAVRTPGYYYASPDRPVSELIMIAGGPAPEAKLAEFEVRRGSRVVLSSKESKRVIKEGRTIEQADLQSGDEVNIPIKRKMSFTQILQVFSVLSVLFFSVFQFLQWYYSRQE